MDEAGRRHAREPVVPKRLVDTLESRIGSPIQVVRGGPGWGKTTLLRQWLAQRPSDRRVRWVVAYSGIDAAGLSGDLVDGWREERSAPLPEGQPADAIQLALIAARSAPVTDGAAILVFDDLQHLVAASAQEFLVALVTRLSDTCHVVLSGRRVPPELEARLGLAFMPALSPADLRLTQQETMETAKALLGGGHLSTETIADLNELTDGWPGGVIAAIRTMQQSGRSLRLRLRELERVLGDYFDREVLAELAPEARRLLLETSIISADFTPELARVLTGTGSTRALAGALEASGGFAHADNNGAYHVVPLLREHLQDELERLQPSRAKLLHRRAALWFEKHGAVSMACREALAAGDAVLAIRLVGFHWLAYSRSGRDATIGAWLDGIEQAIRRDDATVAFIRGWLAGMRGRQRELNAAIVSLASLGNEPIAGGPPTARCGVHLLRAAFVDRVGAHGAGDARAAIAEIEPSSVWSTIANCLLGYHLYWAGDLESARECLSAATARADALLVPAPILQMAFGILGLIDASRRIVPGARENAAHALELGELSSATSASLSVPALVAKGISDAAAGQLETAAAELEQAVIEAERGGNARYLALTYLAMSRLRHLGGDRSAAESWLRSAQSLLEDLPEAAVLHAEAEGAARMMRLRPRRIVAQPDEPTRRELRVLELLAAGLSRSDIARELGVSTDTVKTHVRNLYLKLEADSRAAALERARELGFLRPELPRLNSRRAPH